MYRTGSRGAGRFAPSPSGDLHVGNLRTALLAWLFARSSDRSFRLRMEDLDRVAPGAAERQLLDLQKLGLNWDGEVLRQSGRLPAYDSAICTLQDAGLVYPCFCSRREIHSAASAPHGPDGAYPGTCRNLSPAELRRRVGSGRSPALRLRAQLSEWVVVDELKGMHTGLVDDLVLRRGDGVVAYNLAVVVDDAAQGVDQVVRGDDLLSSAPRQAYLAHLLGLPAVSYAHVPLALNVQGDRLAKRDGAVTMADLNALGLPTSRVLTLIAASLSLAGADEQVTTERLLARFDPGLLPDEPWVVDPTLLTT